MSNYTSAEMLGAAVILTFAIFLISKRNYAFFYLGSIAVISNAGQYNR